MRYNIVNPGAAAIARPILKRVLVPIDGSECSLRAVTYVIGDRTRSGDPDRYEVHLINVQPSFSRDVTQFFSHEQVSAFHRDESAKALAGAEALLTGAGVPHASHAEVGHVADTIVSRAEALACDLIVMGTHGHGALAELLLGSTTAKVIHHARLPLLLIK